MEIKPSEVRTTRYATHAITAMHVIKRELRSQPVSANDFNIAPHLRVSGEKTGRAGPPRVYVWRDSSLPT